MELMEDGTTIEQQMFAMATAEESAAIWSAGIAAAL